MRHFPLRVLMIGPTAYTVGDSSHATFSIWRNLAGGFDRLKVLARARGRGGSWTKDGVEIELIRGVRRREFEFLATQFALIGPGRAFRPDVVVSQGISLGGGAALAIARSCGAGTLIEVHSGDYVERAPLGSKRGVLQRLSGPVFARATLIRVLSGRMGDALIALYGDHLREKIRVLPPRVDTQLFRPPAERKAPDGRLDLAIVGSLVDNKGQLRLLDALVRAGLPINLHIVGDGEDRPKIEERVGELVGDWLRVQLHGLVSHTNLATILAGCDALVMYSKSEGTPRVIMEAMATGLPVITTNAGFCADIVEHGKEGIVLSENETDADLKRHLEGFLQEPEQLRSMGEAALQRAREDFAADILYPRYRTLIAEAAGK